MEPHPPEPHPPEPHPPQENRRESIKSPLPELDDLDKALQGFAVLEEEREREEREKDEELLKQMEREIAKEME